MSITAPASLSASLIRRRQTRLAPPVARVTRSATPEPSGDWSADLRFFVTCYAAGVVFFLVMLS